MTRGIGALEAIHQSVPEWAVVVVAVLTQLGDVWFLALVLGGIYLTGAIDREDAAVLVAFALTGYAVMTALKVGFGFPRPASTFAGPSAFPAVIRPLYDLTATASGYGFPSGHAFATTVVYGGLATRLTIWTLRSRVAVAGTLVAVVCLSRVVLGVHYLVDVVAGVTVGLLTLTVLERVVARSSANRARTAFAIAVGIGLLATLAALAVPGRFDPDLLLLLGASLAGLGGWELRQRWRSTAATA